MKKITRLLGSILLVGGLFTATSSNAQAVRDRNIIPVAVNLNQVLRMTITNGGNIEFVFNTIDDYRYGIAGTSTTAAGVSGPPAAGSQGTGVDAVGASNTAPTTSSSNQLGSNPMYITDFVVASSTRWKITYGSENSEFRGTDNSANIFALNNVGYSLTESGTHNFETGGAKGTTANGTQQLWSTPTNGASEVAALQSFPVTLLEDNDDFTGDATGNNGANAGDVLDNVFQLQWRAGTLEGTGLTTPMNQVSILDQGNITPDRYITNVLFELAIDF